ncbi:MAG: hypothetical protein ABSB22_24185 [Thermodesulfobacteriota bacterium]
MDAGKFAVQLLDVGLHTSSGNGDAFDLWGTGIQGYVEIVLSCNISGDAGGSTIFTLQDSANSSSWANVVGGIFNTVANLGKIIQTKVFDSHFLRRYIRIIWVVVGSVTGYSSVTMMAEKPDSTRCVRYVLSGATVFGFEYTPDSIFNKISFTDVTNGKINVMADATYTIVPTDIDVAYTGPTDWKISGKTTKGFTFNGVPGKNYAFIVTGTISS